MGTYQPNEDTIVTYKNGRVTQIQIYSRFSHGWILVKKPTPVDEDFRDHLSEYESMFASAQSKLDQHLDENKPVFIAMNGRIIREAL